MTDKEIIKALECCSSYQYDYCDKCDFKPKENIKGTVACCMELMRNTLDLIKRQQAENERLQKKVEELSEVLSESIRIRYKEAKSEAVKEFCNKRGIEYVENNV